MSVFEKMFGKGMFGPVPEGKCKLSMNGQIAINTPGGYKTYNVKTGKLTNCSNFAIDVGDMFFIIPTSKVQRGDIIIVDGNPKCVLKEEGNNIEVFSYIDSTISTIVKERHVFMGKQYFYGKIVSMFGNMMSSGKGMGQMMKFAMMSEMMKGNGGGSLFSGGENGMANMLPMMMLMNGGGDMFDGLFSFDDDDESGTAPAVDDEDEEETK